MSNPKPQAKAEEQLRAILETALDGIVVIRADGQIEMVNHAALRMFGYQQEELVGKNVSILMPSPHRENHDGYLSKYLQTGVKHIIGIGRTVEGRRKDGSTFPVELAVGECGEGHNRLFTGFLRDVTQKQQTNQKLHSLGYLLDHIREAIVICDFDGRIVYWNQGAMRLYGWSAQETLGQNCFEFKCKLADNEVQHIKQAVSLHGEWRGELEQITKSGQHLIVESHWSKLQGQLEQTDDILIINIDISERKKLESQFLRAQRLESVGVLAGGIAHDLNNMLTPILMSIKLLRKDRIPEQRNEILNTAQASVERGIEMIRQLLSFAGGYEGVYQTLDLRQIIRDVIKLLGHTVARDIQIIEEADSDLWPLKGDATQLTQVLMNLCVNARDAMPGGGTLTIQASNITLTQESCSIHPQARPGRFLLMTVADAGIGIPGNIIDKIFDPFFTTKGIGKGTGLGLSTALGIIRSHGGFINVYSEPGQGTKFTVYLPAISGTPQDTPGTANQATAKGHVVLLVDDEQNILTTAKLCLEAHDYKVYTATNGLEAVLTFQQYPEIEVVLLDMMMPGMDGPEVMKQLQRIRPEVRVIASSGLKGTKRLQDAKQAGAKGFLQKPYSEEELVHCLNTVLSIR